jgi:hypothetical protein
VKYFYLDPALLNPSIDFRIEYHLEEVTVQVLDAQREGVFEESAALPGTPTRMSSSSRMWSGARSALSFQVGQTSSGSG